MLTSSIRYRRTIGHFALLLLLSAGLVGPSAHLALAQTGTLRADALVLVNSTSAGYSDFGHYIQPYLDHFGIPYTLLDIATAPVGSDIDDYALIIVGHRQIDVTGTYLDATEQTSISTAVDAGTGLVNFDNDLSVGGTTGRYQFVQDIFDFGYVAPSSQSGVTFLSNSGSYVRINCWEDTHQDPVLATTSNVDDLVPDDNQWTEFLWTNRGYPGVFAGYHETPPVMHFYGAVPDGEYRLIAHLYWSHNLRYYWGYTEADPGAYSYDVTSGVSGDFADYELGTVTVAGGQFDLYVQNADPLAGGVDYPFYAWAWIRLVPADAPAPDMHYITERHQAGETISTGSMTMAGITLPATATALATSGTQPFLAVTTSGMGRAVQWGSYNWMSHSVKGPVYGLDDLVWRSIVWAARKPFVMQGLPPFVTMRVDDESGPFWWIHIANEFGIKPWAGLFYHNVDAAEAADLSALVHAGQATASVHAKNGAFFYYNHGSGDFSDAIVAANYAEATAWHTQRDIPISKFVLPHYYEFGTNVFQGLEDWGVEFVGTMMNPGNGYGAPWVMNGPYRLYETGSSSEGRPVYYADFMTIPGHPEFDGHFFNCVTEIRDDAGYEWYPSNDVPGSIGRGTRQTVRALDSMALATLFTHGYYPAGITPDNWRAILQGITDNIAGYNPTYVTMDHACQYVRAMHASAISGSIYDPASRELTTSLSGSTDMPTMFYLFVDQADSIVSTLVDVPIFAGTTDVVYTLAGPLDSIVVTPALATVVTGGTQQFTATGYDADGNPIPNLPITWEVVNGGGTIAGSGLFTAGGTPGTYLDTVRAAYGGIEGRATVEVIAPALDHFTFDPMSNPQYVDVPFTITIRARDLSGNLLTGYIGQATLSDTTGTLVPAQTGGFVGGVWSGEVTITQTASGVTLTAADGGASGISNAFNVQSVPTYYTLSSASYQHHINTPFDVTVDAYGGAEIDLWADEHQEPVLTTFTNPALLNDQDGLWDEFWYQTGRPFPAVFGGHNEWEDHGLAPMHFFATGIPDGGYAVWANLYTGGSAATTYYYGFTESEALNSARSVTNVGGAGGSDQFDEYLLGTVQVSNNHFDLWAGDGDSTSPYFYAWASARLVPVENEVFIDCSDDAHQDPALATTSNVGDLSATDGEWTEFLYLSSRPYPTILAGVDEENYGLPTMRFYTTGIANGTYEVIANLYDNSPMRYYYGYSAADPKALYVDVPGGASGTQHREYSLGTITVTDGTFNLYVLDADLLPGGTYPFFGWAWIRLVDHYAAMTSSSAAMSFDGNGNGVFGEPGDEVISLSGETATIAAISSAAANDVMITATDALGRWGATSYDIIYPTAVTLTSFEASPGAGHIVLTWETSTEIDNLGFSLYRSARASGPYTRLNDTLIPSRAPGLPTGATYEWTDAGVAAGVTYYYQLEAVDMRGGLAHLGPVSAKLHAFRFYLPLVTR